jgi:hypothetical protein
MMPGQAPTTTVPGTGTGSPLPKEMPKGTAPDKPKDENGTKPKDGNGTKPKDGASLDPVAPVTPVTGSGSPY